MRLKATSGNIDKHTIITKAYPNQDTITSQELREVSQDNASELLASDGKTSLAYYITYNFGTGKRGVYHLPKLIDGYFVADEIEDSAKSNTLPTEKVSSSKVAKVEESAKSNTLPNAESLLGYIPEVDKTYVKFGHHKDIVKILKSELFYPIFVTGLSGNGKTFGVEQACAETKRELVRVNITIETDEDDLLGGFRLENGETVFHKGPVVEALERGAVLLLDEVDLASSKILCLQPILEGKGVFLKKINEWVHPTDGFTIIATANTKGKGSESGAFVGTNVLNEAFIDRFAITLEQAYPPVTTETKIIKNVFNYDC